MAFIERAGGCPLDVVRDPSEVRALVADLAGDVRGRADVRAADDGVLECVSLADLTELGVYLGDL